MELKGIKSQGISRNFRANVENLQPEKTGCLMEIDALDQEALKIKEYKMATAQKPVLNAELII